jgi:hypothetical protein
VVRYDYQIGETPVGMRTNSASFGAALDQVLATYRTEPRDTTPEYSILVGGENGEGGRGKKYHILYSGSSKIARTLSPLTLVSTLLSELGAHLLPERADALYASAGAVNAAGVGGLIPTWLAVSFLSLGRRVKKAGLTLAAERVVAVDLETGRLIPVPRTLEVPAGAEELLLEALPANGAPPDCLVVERPTEIGVVCLSNGSGEDQTVPASRAYTVSMLAAQALNLRTLGVSGLEALSELVVRARCYDLPRSGAEGALGILSEVMRTG